MSLNWKWNDKMGEVTDKNGYTANLYRGNAFMIAIKEWQDQEEGDLYTLAWFFANEAHMKNCLGLSKGYEENSPEDWNWASFKLDVNYKETQKFVAALAKAKANIVIELYNGKEQNKND